MAAKTISVSLPESHVKRLEGTAKRAQRTRSDVVRQALDAYFGSAGKGADEAEAQRKWNRELVMELLRSTTISAGRAAQLLGVSRWELVDLMAEHHISAMDADDTSLQDELQAIAVAREAGR